MKLGEMEGYERVHIIDAAKSFRKLGDAWTDTDGSQVGFVMKQQLVATAQLLENIMAYSGRGIKLESGHRRDITRALWQKGVKVSDLACYENQRGQFCLWMRAKQLRGTCMTVSKAAAVISQYFDGEFISHQSNRNIIGKEFEDYCFVQAPRYKLLIGRANCPKSGNTISGDSVNISNLESARTVIGLWDGMGNGKQANIISGQAVEMMEYLLEAGFDEASAIGLINSVFSTGAQSDRTVAVDIGVIDCYLGTLNCLKMGAVSTFIKRDGIIEVIKSTTLPIGIMSYVDCDTTVKKLYDGDFIIMVSDGVLENFTSEDKEMALVQIIAGLDSNNAGQLANQILDVALNQLGGVAKDDMSVIVAGVFDTNIKVY